MGVIRSLKKRRDCFKVQGHFRKDSLPDHKGSKDVRGECVLGDTNLSTRAGRVGNLENGARVCKAFSATAKKPKPALACSGCHWGIVGNAMLRDHDPSR